MDRIDDHTIIDRGIRLGETPHYDFSRYYQADHLERREIVLEFLMMTGEQYRKEFRELLDALKQFESLLYATSKFYRDHMLHTFRVWGLGLYLYHNGLKEVWNEEASPDFHFTWYVASVYHDVGYPITGLHKLEEELNNSFNPLDVHDIADFGEKINSSLNTPELSDCLRTIMPHEIPNTSILKQRHGLISARLVLYTLQRRFSWWYKDEVCPALIAMADHDSCRDINFQEAPFSALLVICDELQEWSRAYVSPLLGERYISTDHIELGLQNTPEPVIQARIDYRKAQRDLFNILGWKGERAYKDQRKNLDRLEGINVDVTMEYTK